VQSPHQNVILLKIRTSNRLFEITNSAVNDLRRSAGRCAREVSRFDKHRSQPAQLCIQSAGRSGGATPDHAQVKVSSGNLSSYFRSAPHG
jgi:hypothetical protein